MLPYVFEERINLYIAKRGIPSEKGSFEERDCAIQIPLNRVDPGEAAR